MKRIPVGVTVVLFAALMLGITGCASFTDRLEDADAAWSDGNHRMGEPPLVERIIDDPDFEARAKAARDLAERELHEAGMAVVGRSPDAGTEVDEAEAAVDAFRETLELEPIQ